MVLEARNAKDNFNAGWGDLVLMSMPVTPASAVKFVESTPEMKVEGGNSRAFLLS